MIFRNTPQWFIRMDQPLEGAARPCARRRPGGHRRTPPSTPRPAATASARMVEGRPDWLISRQRAWGTPLAMFVDKHTGQPLHDAEVNARILAADRRRAAPTPGSPGPTPTSSATTTRPTTRRSRTSSTSGSTPARPTPSPWRAAQRHAAGRPTSISKAPTSTAAGSSPPAGRLRHPRPRALRRRPDPRLHPGRERGEDVQVARATPPSPQSSSRRAAPTSCACGSAMVDYAEDQRIGKTDPADHGRRLSQAAQHRPLPAGRPGRLRRGRARARYADMPPLERFILHRLWELDAQVRAAYETYRFQDVVPPGAGVLRQRPVGPVFRHPQGQPLLRPPRRDPPPRRPAR